MNWKNEIKDVFIIFSLCILFSFALGIFTDFVLWQNIIIIVLIVTPINILLKKYGDVKPFKNWRAGKNL